MARGDVETFFQDGKWHNRIEGTTEVFGTADTQEAALEKGKQRAKADKVSLSLVSLDGSVKRISNFR
jgi:hypothetical protein